MRKFIFIYIRLILISTLLSLFSCKSTYPEYGVKMLKLTNDSASTAAAKKLLNSLPDQDFLTKSFLTKDSQIIPYRLLTPVNNQPAQKYPLIITLHNSSRIGSDNKAQLEPLARLWLAARIRKKYPAYVLAPQFSVRSASYITDQKREILTSVAAPQLAAILDLVDSLKKNYNIDENRIYLVGYSMGGSSVIDLLNLRPGAFAAAVAVAPVPQFANTDALRRVPIWLIHGSEDSENPFAGSKELYKEISTLQKTRFWIFEHRTHDNIVSPALLGENIPGWLFTKRRLSQLPVKIAATPMP